MKTDSKEIEYIQTRLRSATDIYKQGGHVTMVYKDQSFRLHYDNKRLLDVSKLKLNEEMLLDSEPLTNLFIAKSSIFL
jgi:hypothetical protein